MKTLKQSIIILDKEEDSVQVRVADVTIEIARCCTEDEQWDIRVKRPVADGRYLGLTWAKLEGIDVDDSPQVENKSAVAFGQIGIRAIQR